MNTFLSFFALLVFVLPAVVEAQTEKKQMTPDEFAESMRSQGLIFTMPEGFHSVPVKENRDLSYQFAIISPDSAFEIRYSVWSLEQALIDYEECQKDSNCTMVDPNKIYFGRNQANLLNMTAGQGARFERFPDQGVKEEFNADIGGAAMFELNCEFGEGYRYGQSVVLHKDNVADVIITYMSNDVEVHKKYLLPCFYTLTFQ